MGKKMIRFKKESILMIDKIVDSIKSWGKDRCGERTSWDGAVLIIVGCVVLFGAATAMPAHLAAILGIVYGVVTISKSCNCKCPSCVDKALVDLNRLPHSLPDHHIGRVLDVEQQIHDKKKKG